MVNGLRLCAEIQDYACPRGATSNCTSCPYADTGGCMPRLMRDAIDLLNEYDYVLQMMVYQYCTIGGVDSVISPTEKFNHSYMSAGENAFDLLDIRNGDPVPDDFAGLGTEV